MIKISEKLVSLLIEKDVVTPKDFITIIESGESSTLISFEEKNTTISIRYNNTSEFLLRKNGIAESSIKEITKEKLFELLK